MAPDKQLTPAARQSFVENNPTLPVKELAKRTGWGERTIKRDRARLGLVNPNRQNGQHS